MWGRRAVPAVLVAALLTLPALTGCGDGTDRADAAPAPAGGEAVALVVAGHANAPAATVPADGAAAVDAAARAGGRAAVVVADGTPTVTGGSLAVSCENPTACATRTAARRDAVLATAAGARADTPETDLLGAVTLAARALGPGPAPRTLVVVDPGLSTAGLLRFQDAGMLDARPDEIVAFLRRADALPDLTGVRVVLAGIGDTAAPQEPLDTARRRALVDVWTAVVRAAGAADVRVDGSPRTAPGPAGLPPVTPVDVPAPPSFTPDAGGTRLTEAEVGFRPDSAELLDPVATRERLGPLAAALRDGSRVVVTGATASAGSPEGRLTLSTERARTVARVLVDLGVAADRITARGVGSELPGRVPDLDASGALLPGPAARNRVVVVQRLAS